MKTFWVIEVNGRLKKDSVAPLSDFRLLFLTLVPDLVSNSTGIINPGDMQWMVSQTTITSASLSSMCADTTLINLSTTFTERKQRNPTC